MGLNQQNWPPKPNTNPFIPIFIQKKMALPHSSIEQELQFCKNLVNKFKNSSHQEVIFSYINQTEGRVNEPSFLIDDVQEKKISDLNLPKIKTKNIINKTKGIANDDDLAQIINYNTFKGGNRLVELQSNCPFRAFVEFKLLVDKNTQPQHQHKDKLIRGILIHRILESFWKQVKNHQNLCNFDKYELHELLNEKIHKSLTNLDSYQLFNLSKNTSSKKLNIEHKCLFKILNNWLEIEKQRQPFEVIDIEKELSINFADNMQIKLRIDRIDRILEDQSLLLIDYKTGKHLPSVVDFFGDRPINTQK